MKFIQELYELQEEQLTERGVNLIESADEILTKSAAMLAHGKGILDLAIVSGLSNKEQQGVGLVASIIAGIDAIIQKSARQPDEKKQAILTILNQAEFKTNDKWATKLAILGQKQTELLNQWQEKLGALHAAQQTFAADTKNAEARDAYMALAKEVETRLKKMSLDLIKTKAALDKGADSAVGTQQPDVKLA